MRWLLAVAWVASVPVAVRGEEVSGEIRFRTGAMPLFAYVEMVSDALGLQLQASTVERSPGPVVEVREGGPMSREEAMARFLSALALQGFTLVQDADLVVHRVLRLRDARDENIPLVTDPVRLPDNDLLVIHPIGLRHYPADGAARLLRSFAPASSRLVPDPATNTLFVTDSARAMLKYRALVSRLDTPQGGKEAKAYLRSRSKAEACRAPGPEPRGTVLIVLFSLVGLIVGFLGRGYVIRRIEGGL